MATTTDSAANKTDSTLMDVHGPLSAQQPQRHNFLATVLNAESPDHHSRLSPPKRHFLFDSDEEDDSVHDGSNTSFVVSPPKITGYPVIRSAFDDDRVTDNDDEKEDLPSFRRGSVLTAVGHSQVLEDEKHFWDMAVQCEKPKTMSRAASTADLFVQDLHAPPEALSRPDDNRSLTRKFYDFEGFIPELGRVTSPVRHGDSSSCGYSTDNYESYHPTDLSRGTTPAGKYQCFG